MRSDLAISEIDYILDDARKEIFDIIASLPQADNKKELPRVSGIYFYIDHHLDEILYIGQSVDIKQRWYGRKDFSLGDPRWVHWLSQSSKYYDPKGLMRYYKNYESKDSIEGLMLFLFKPRFNRQFRGSVYG